MNNKKSSNKPLIIAIIIATIILVIETIYLVINHLEKNNTTQDNENKIVNNYFQDENFSNCIVKYYNNSNNTNYTNANQLTDKQLASIKVLRCPMLTTFSLESGIVVADSIKNYKGIEKLTGLEQFITWNSEQASNLNLKHNTKLSKIDITYTNEDSSLEVTGLNNLINLTQFRGYGIKIDETNNLSNLTNLTKLQLYDVDANINGNFTNPNLKEIEIENVNLTNIDVSNLKLTKLNLTIPTLNSLNLGNQQNLTEIEINDGTLTNTDFSGCPNLENIVIPEKMPCVNINYYTQVSKSYKTSNGYMEVGNGVIMTYDGITMDGRNLICEH